MWRFLARRIAHAAVVIFLVATVIFVFLHLAPGDPCLPGERSLPQDFIERCRRNFGLDRPLIEQYARYVINLLRGNFGYSFTTFQPAWSVIGPAVPNTILLATAALGINFTMGIVVGTLQGARANTRLDQVLTTLTVVVFSIPAFWFGVIVILLIAEPVSWLPTAGVRSVADYASLPLLGKVLDRLRHLVLPATTLGLVSAAFTARHHRSAMMDAVAADFVRTARAKGLKEWVVMTRHALRNALLPAITLFGLSLPVLLGGSVIVERVFGYRGMGLIAFEGVGEREYHIVTAAGILAGTMVVVGSLVADLLYWVVDPRIRRSP